jgi:hypothetical protein
VALDLTSLRPRLNELILVDRCEVWRDPEGTTDDVTDSATGSVSSPDRMLLETVQCKIKPVYRAFPGIRGGEPIQVGTFEMSKVANGVRWRLGDQVKMTVSPHHPEMVGRWFRVSENLNSSLGLFIKVRLESRERPDDRP